MVRCSQWRLARLPGWWGACKFRAASSAIWAYSERAARWKASRAAATSPRSASSHPSPSEAAAARSGFPESIARWKAVRAVSASPWRASRSRGRGKRRRRLGVSGVECALQGRLCGFHVCVFDQCDRELHHRPGSHVGMPEVTCVLVGRPCAVQVALMDEQDSERECCRSDRLVALRRFQARAWMRCFRAMRVVCRACSRNSRSSRRSSIRAPQDSQAAAGPKCGRGGAADPACQDYMATLARRDRSRCPDTGHMSRVPGGRVHRVPGRA